MRFQISPREKSPGANSYFVVAEVQSQVSGKSSLAFGAIAFWVDAAGFPTALPLPAATGEKL